MGRALLKAAQEQPGITITGAIVREGSPALGEDAGVLAGGAPLKVAVSCDLPLALKTADVAIDFSRPENVPATLMACAVAGRAVLLGITGLTVDVVQPSLAIASKVVPVLMAPNTSLGGALLAELTRIAAAALPGSFDIEIIEAHHRAKRDAPSGTALGLGKAAAVGRSQALPASQARSASRVPGEIGYAVVRAGDIVGEHTVLFAGDGEQLSLVHRATDRMIFARGALRAAVWLCGQAPGVHTMRDLFKLNQ
jgi:4-hydroxy-tetrahydrodipicolinate reductase